MKKLFFFLLLFCPLIVHASSIKEFEVFNGTLESKFVSSNNTYSITLNDGETKPIIHYTLIEENATAKEIEQKDKLIIEVTNQEKEKEIYTFYINKKETQQVFKESKPTEIKENPYLKYEVGISCFIIILFLFKTIVLGWHHKK